MFIIVSFSYCKQEIYKTVQTAHMDRTDWQRDRGDMEMGGWDLADHKVHALLFLFKWIIIKNVVVLYYITAILLNKTGVGEWGRFYMVCITEVEMTWEYKMSSEYN